MFGIAFPSATNEFLSHHVSVRKALLVAGRAKLMFLYLLTSADADSVKLTRMSPELWSLCTLASLEETKGGAS